MNLFTTENLQAIGLGLFTIILWQLLTKYWNYRSKKSLKRRIKEVTTEHETVVALATSFENAVLTFFGYLFLLLFLLGLALLIEPFWSFASGDKSLLSFLEFTIRAAFVMSAVFVIKRFQQVKNYPESYEKLRKKSKALEARLKEMEAK